MTFPRVHIWHWRSRRWPMTFADQTAASYLSMQGEYMVLIEKAVRPVSCCASGRQP